MVESRISMPEFHEDDIRFDWIVCYGFRKIIKEPWLSAYKGRIINIHIGFLPWNRGADPNLWSWFDNTTKGVTIHEIDEGIDTGPILAQCEVGFNWTEPLTLASSYNALRKSAVLLFTMMWPAIRIGSAERKQQRLGGSSHEKKDAREIIERFSDGWNTPVEEIIEFGKQHRCRKLSAS